MVTKALTVSRCSVVYTASRLKSDQSPTRPLLRVITPISLICLLQMTALMPHVAPPSRLQITGNYAIKGPRLEQTVPARAGVGGAEKYEGVTVVVVEVGDWDGVGGVRPDLEQSKSSGMSPSQRNTAGRLSLVIQKTSHRLSV